MALHMSCAHIRSGLPVTIRRDSCVSPAAVRVSGSQYCFSVQVNRSCSSDFATGGLLRPATRLCLKRKAPHATVAATATGATTEVADRFRLNNLSPQKGARRQEKRKGRGYGSGQVRLCTCSAMLMSVFFQLNTGLILCRVEPVVSV